jgi:ABC-type Fe3+-hydroxamate transport system substrate-binding protein
MGRLSAGAACAAALLLAGTACGERSEPTGPTLRLYPITVTDAGDHRVALETAPKRIATLTPAGDEILAALGLRERIVDPPSGFFGTKGELLVDRLRRVHADLIVASGDRSTSSGS